LWCSRQLGTSSADHAERSGLSFGVTGSVLVVSEAASRALLAITNHWQANYLQCTILTHSIGTKLEI
jgi:hypothetical protein